MDVPKVSVNLKSSVTSKGMLPNEIVPEVSVQLESCVAL